MPNKCATKVLEGLLLKWERITPSVRFLSAKHVKRQYTRTLGPHEVPRALLRSIMQSINIIWLLKQKHFCEEFKGQASLEH